MKRAFAGLALGALLCSPVGAATSIDTAAFTITYMYGTTSEDWSITQVDMFPDTYSFSLDTLNQHLTGVEAHDIAGAGASSEQASWNTLRLDTHAGYRISRVMLTGVAFGQLSPGQLPDFPQGIVHNAANAYLTLASAMTWSSLNSDLGAENAIDLASYPLTLTGSAQVGISAMIAAQAWGVEGGGAFAESFASASIRDLTLHVEVMPIPEPHAGLMLAAGLGIVGIFARFAPRSRRLP